MPVHLAEVDAQFTRILAVLDLLDSAKAEVAQMIELEKVIA